MTSYDMLVLSFHDRENVREERRKRLQAACAGHTETV